MWCCIIQERELGRPMTTEEIEQNVQRYGLHYND